jgi:hypothetical protein
LLSPLYVAYQSPSAVYRLLQNVFIEIIRQEIFRAKQKHQSLSLFEESYLTESVLLDVPEINRPAKL